MLSIARLSSNFSHFIRHLCNRASPKVPHVAIIGSGPAGFYSAQHILKKLGTHVRVDIFEKNPVPFGLVRYGVAPDHPEVKNVINTFTQVAENPQCNFFGNVEVGKDVSLKDLRTCYTAIILAYGCSEDKRLNVPGEKLKNVLSASSVVNWYNGYPGFQDIDINLKAETCIVLGQGNVAIDVARILLSPISLLEKTDISKHALDKLSENKIKRIYVVGRRGPPQAAFTPAEFRETLKIPGCRPVLKKDDYSNINLSDVQRPKKRLIELQMKTVLEGPSDQERERRSADKEIHYVFKRSPLRFLPDGRERDSVGAVEFSINEMEGSGPNDKAVPTGLTETIGAHLVIKSVGYHGMRIEEDLIFDDNRKILPNEFGRVSGFPGLYCSGWIKTGPVGVIATTMNSAFDTGRSVVEDLMAGLLKDDDKAMEMRDTLLANLGGKYVTFSDWKKLDGIEIECGKSRGKSREKIADKSEMVKLMRD